MQQELRITVVYRELCSRLQRPTCEMSQALCSEKQNSSETGKHFFFPPSEKRAYQDQLRIQRNKRTVSDGDVIMKQKVGRKFQIDFQLSQDRGLIRTWILVADGWRCKSVSVRCHPHSLPCALWCFPPWHYEIYYATTTGSREAGDLSCSCQYPHRATSHVCASKRHFTLFNLTSAKQPILDAQYVWWQQAGWMNSPVQGFKFASDTSHTCISGII